jgi:peptide/nickel transport system permease protein
MRLFARRVAHGLVLVAGVSVLSFVFIEMAPGGFVDEMRLDPRIAPETVAALRRDYGLDHPLPVRYAHWLGSVFRGELGFSFAYNVPAADLLWPRAVNTLLLAVTASLLAWSVAIPLGVWSAAREGRWPDRLCAGGATALLALPDVLVALTLLFFAVKTGMLPVGGMTSPGLAEAGLWTRVRDVAAHMLLPVTGLAIGIAPALTRHVRSSLVDALRSTSLQAARARGVDGGRLLFRHALRLAANPLISLAGFTVAGLLSMSLLVEVVMSWPGLGPLLVEAILARDVHVVVGSAICSTVLLVGGNLLGDLLLYAVDPRTRSEHV